MSIMSALTNRLMVGSAIATKYRLSNADAKSGVLLRCKLQGILGALPVHDVSMPACSGGKQRRTEGRQGRMR